MDFRELRGLIINKADKSFVEASDELETILFNISTKETISLLTEIGIIPEDIAHDSTEEKLYTKVSDILFAKALKELNLEVRVLRERSNCADIIAQSKFHGYSLVGDAKAFRLSRTAKNAKDFKVESMVHWRGDNDYAVLTCPYFQYPRSNSQIYKSALDGNVALFSWEYLHILLSSKVKETQNVNLCDLWNQSAIIRQNVTIENANKCFLGQQDVNIQALTRIPSNKYNLLFSKIKDGIITRGNNEIQYFMDEISRIRNLDKETAIEELIRCMKLDSKIETIRNFINQIQR